MRELWARNMSTEVKEAWQKAREVLSEKKEETPLICTEWK